MIAEALPAGRVQVIHNGIAIGEPPSAAARLAARQFLRASRETLVIGTIGRLDPVKDFSTLLRSVALLRQSHPPVCLLLIGDGPERHRLQEEAVKLGIADAVTFAGYRGDAREFEVGVLLGIAVPREVLGRREHAVLLDAADECRSEAGDEVRVLTSNVGGGAAAR